MVVDLILNKLNVKYEDVAKKKHGKCPEITYGHLISTIISDNNQHAASSLFPIGVQTFNRLTKKVFPGVRLNGGCQTWFFYLLSLINHKKCGSCNTIKLFTDFNLHKNNSTLGLASICKDCRSEAQQGQYVRYIDSHNKSNTKLKEIKAERNRRYKGERSLRIPSWSETSEIELFYRNCPEGYQVDHELPLKGELVSGLHVLANLQYLPKKENLSKNNKIDLDFYNKKYYKT